MQIQNMMDVMLWSVDERQMTNLVHDVHDPIRFEVKGIKSAPL